MFGLETVIKSQQINATKQNRYPVMGLNQYRYYPCYHQNYDSPPNEFFSHYNFFIIGSKIIIINGQKKPLSLILKTALLIISILFNPVNFYGVYLLRISTDHNIEVPWFPIIFQIIVVKFKVFRGNIESHFFTFPFL